MGRTYRRRALDRKKTLRKQRGGLVEEKNSACTDEHRPLLACHLHADMVHDFGAKFVHEEVISHPPEFMVYDDSGVQGCKTDEDAIVQLFQTGNIGDTLIPNRPERMGTKLIFSVQEETAVFGNDNVPVVLPRPKVDGVQRNMNVAIVQDAGKQLFKELGVTNLITFGSILDPALKPIQKTETPMVFVPPDGTQLLLRTCEYGFNEGLLDQVCIAKFDGNFVSCGFHLTDEGGKNKWVDAIEMQDVNEPTELTGRKPINNVNIVKAGYFTSIANATDPVSQVAVREKLGQPAGDIPLQHQRRLFIGKTLGDVLLVASIERNVTTPTGMVSNPFLPGNGATLRNFTTGVELSPNPSLSYFVLNTGDRLNHTRAFIKGVPSIYQQRRKGEEKEKDAVKTFEYIPGALLAGEEFPGAVDYYKGLIESLAGKARERYGELIANLTAESGLGAAGGAGAAAGTFERAFARFTVTGQDLPPGKEGIAAQLINDVLAKLRILQDVIPTFFTAIVANVGDVDNAKTAYRRACEYFKLLTPQKTTFQFQTGDVTLMTPALVVIRLPSNVNFSDLIPGGLSDPRIPGGLKGTFTIKLLRAFDNIRRGDSFEAVVASGTEYYKYFRNKFVLPDGGQRGGANASTATEYDHLVGEAGFVVKKMTFAIPEVEKVRAFYMSSYSQEPQREELYANLPLLDLFNHRRAGYSMDEPLQMALHLQAYKDNGSVLDPQLATRFIEEAKRLHQASGGSTYPVEGRTESILVRGIGPAESGTQTEWTLAFNSFAECLNADISERFGFIDAEEKEVAESDNNLLRAMFGETCAKFVGMTERATQIQDGYTLAGSPPQTPVRAVAGPAGDSQFTASLDSRVYPGSEGHAYLSTDEASQVARALPFPRGDSPPPGTRLAQDIRDAHTLSPPILANDPNIQPPREILLDDEATAAFRILVGEYYNADEVTRELLQRRDVAQAVGMAALSPETARTGTATPTEEEQAEMRARLLAEEATRLRGIAQQTRTPSDIAAAEVAARAAQEAENRLAEIREAQSDEKMGGIPEARAVGRKRARSPGRYSRDEIETGVENLRTRIQKLRETLKTLNLGEAPKEEKRRQIEYVEDGLRFVESLLNTSLSEAGESLERLKEDVENYEEEILQGQAEQAIAAAREFINRNQGDPRLTERQEMLNDANDLYNEGAFQEAINTANNSRGPLGGGARRVLPDLNLPPPMAGRRRRSHRKRL